MARFRSRSRRIGKYQRTRSYNSPSRGARKFLRRKVTTKKMKIFGIPVLTVGILAVLGFVFKDKIKGIFSKSE
jgi:hypothetical protein